MAFWTEPARPWRSLAMMLGAEGIDARRRSVPLAKPTEDGLATKSTRLDTLPVAQALRVLAGAPEAGPVLAAWAGAAPPGPGVASRGARVPAPRPEGARRPG